ncbi:MAG: hypothetical protein AAF441_12875 [Pseudomonadota bacterium]
MPMICRAALAATLTFAVSFGAAQAGETKIAANTFAAEHDPIASFLTTGETGAKPCLNPRSGDRDIFRNAKALTGHCIRLHRIREAGKTWQIYEIGGQRRGPLWAVLHDNENAAFDAAVTGLNRYGGRIVAIEAGEKRKFHGQDPNRNFGIKRCRNQRGSGVKYTTFMMMLVDKSTGVVGMHNNANGFAGGGGSGHINVFRKSRVLIGHPSRYAKGAFKDGDNFILVPGRGGWRPGSRPARKIARLNKSGIHAVYEKVLARANDCSMSNHLVLSGYHNYVNIEVQHGQARVQRALLKPALNALR